MPFPTCACGEYETCTVCLRAVGPPPKNPNPVIRSFAATVVWTPSPEERRENARTVEQHYHGRDTRPLDDPPLDLTNPSPYVEAVYAVHRSAVLNVTLNLHADGTVSLENPS